MLKDGDPAQAWNVWIRVITDCNYWKKDGTLHNKAFTGKGGFMPPLKARPWSHELSGRLLSLVTNLREESMAFCEGLKRDFAGIMFQHVEGLRSQRSGFPTDVIYTPVVAADEAHSDLTVKHAVTEDDLRELRDWLQDNIFYVKPDKLSAVCTLRENFPST
jgi:hypothetical protein